METLAAPRPPDALAARVGAATAALPQDERTALWLRERLGSSYGEIAEELGTDRDGVADLLLDARLAVREAVRHAPAPELRTADCGDVRLLLTLRQDGEPLAPEETARLRAHVGDCEACTAVRRILREASLASRAWEATPVPTALPTLALPVAPAPAAAAPEVADAPRPKPRRRGYDPNAHPRTRPTRRRRLE